MAAVSYRNEFQMTDEMLDEYLEVVLRRRPWKGGAVVAVIAALAAGNSLRNGNLASALVFFLCLFIVVTALLVTPNRARKAALQQKGKAAPVCVMLGDHIDYIVGGEKRKTEYKDITAMYYLSHVWVLTSGKGQHILIEPHSFAEGQPEEVCRFLEERCGGAALHRVESD